MGNQVGINIRRNYRYNDSHDVLVEKFTSLQQAEEKSFILQIANDLISLNINKEQQRWWSPEMTLRLENEGNETVIYEVVGPNSSIFTLAMFFVMLGSVTFLAALMMSLSQFHIGESPIQALVVTFFSGLLILVTFAGLAMGRMKAAGQVSQLRQFVGDVIEH